MHVACRLFAQPVVNIALQCERCSRMRACTMMVRPPKWWHSIHSTIGTSTFPVEYLLITFAFIIIVPALKQLKTALNYLFLIRLKGLRIIKKKNIIRILYFSYITHHCFVLYKSSYKWRFFCLMIITPMLVMS